MSSSQDGRYTARECLHQPYNIMLTHLLSPLPSDSLQNMTVALPLATFLVSVSPLPSDSLLVIGLGLGPPSHCHTAFSTVLATICTYIYTSMGIFLYNLHATAISIYLYIYMLQNDSNHILYNLHATAISIYLYIYMLQNDSNHILSLSLSLSLSPLSLSLSLSLSEGSCRQCILHSTSLPAAGTQHSQNTHSERLNSTYSTRC